MHLTSTEWLWFTAAVSILGTVAVFLLWIWFTRRAHRGEHGRHDPNNSPAAVTAEAAKPSRAREPFREFQARLKTNQRCRTNPHSGGRHAAPEPAAPTSQTGKASIA
jgi:hypothetical protein